MVTYLVIVTEPDAVPWQNVSVSEPLIVVPAAFTVNVMSSESAHPSLRLIEMSMRTADPEMVPLTEPPLYVNSGNVPGTTLPVKVEAPVACVMLNTTGALSCMVHRPVRFTPAAPWLIVTVWPATVTVPVRVAAVFAATVTLTVPLPLPLAGDTVRNVALLDAVQELGLQPLGPTVTVTDTVPPLLATGPAVVGDTVKVHTAACVIVSVWPAIVTVAVRATAAVFAATVTVTEPPR